MRLTTQQKQFWLDNGYLVVENVIPLDIIQLERERMAWWCDHWNSPDAEKVGIEHEVGLPQEKWNNKTVRKLNYLAKCEPAFRAHALHENMLDLVGELIGTPFSYFESQAFLKPPSLGSPKPAHQDNAYFKVTPADAVITAWGAIDDATLENGCMHYHAGSHKLGLVKHHWIPGTSHQVPEGFDDKKATPAPVKAGGIVFHHGLTLHLSLENRSPNWRRAFACHYVRNDADLSEASTKREALIPARG